MRNRRTSYCLICPILLLAVAPGCQSLHLYRPSPVQVVDAETKKPIPGIEVRISYPLSNSNFAPFESIAATGADGIARLKAAPYGDAGIMVDVSGTGYMNEQKFMTVEQVEKFETAHFFEDVNRRPASMIVELYAEPRPTIELVVPAGYHGIVKAKIKVDDKTKAPPGMRNFTYELPASAEIAVVGPDLFRHAILPDMRLKYSGGIPLSKQAKESDLGYWYVKSEDGYQFFLVATQREFDDFRRAMMNRHVMKDRVHGSRPDEGRGRHSRQGDSSSDSGALSPSTPPDFFDRSGAGDSLINSNVVGNSRR